MKTDSAEKLKENVQKLKKKFVNDLEEQLGELIDEFVNEVEVTDSLSKSDTDVHENDKDKGSNTSNKLKDKKFIERSSLLTSISQCLWDLFNISHIQTIYHIFIAILILLFLSNVVFDFVDTGKLNLDFELIIWAFGKLQTVMAIWVAMFLSTVVFFIFFHRWACSSKERIWNYIYLGAYILYLGLLLYFPCQKVIENKLPPASSLIILMEQVRMVMKSHAFLRSNVSKAFACTSTDNGSTDSSPCPDFSKFLYFFFAPTLVYSDSYPRNNSIRWYYVITNFSQVIGCLFYVYFLFAKFCIPIFHKFGREPFTFKNLVLSVFGCMMPGTLGLICAFFALLHSWMNAFAEMLRFADRMFYMDWWNSTSFGNYYRTWNILVHDWLYTYVYKDVYECISNKLVAMFVVFAVSAIVHEYILTFTFRFFYPVLLLMFGGCGVVFVFLTDKRKARSWNVFMWLSLFMGTGLLMSLYSLEWYARINCPPYDDTFLDHLIPRSWICFQANEALPPEDFTNVKTEL